MKTLVKLFVLFITTVVFAQSPIEKPIAEFTELKVFDLIEVELVKSNENKVLITGKNKENVVVINKEGKLKIKMSLEESFDGEGIKVILHYTSLDIIDVNEGAKVTSKNTFKQSEITLRAQEGGEIYVNLDVSYAKIKSVTGGYIRISGVAKKQDISILTGGIYRGKELKSEDTDVEVKAAGEAYVSASNLVDARIRAGGSIFIYGNPKTVTESKMLGGQIVNVK